MRKLASSVIAGLLLTLLLPVLLVAQQPINFLVFEEHVSPSVRNEFMKVQQEAADLWKKYDMDIPVFCYSHDDNGFYWVIPITNFASIDTMFSKMGKMSEKMKKDGYNGDEKFKDLSTVSSSVIMWEPELSYHPNDEFGQTMDKRYVEWTFCYLRSGHEKEAATAIKKYIDFYKEKGDNYPWDVFRVIMGEDMPALIFMIRSADRVALHSLEKELSEKYQTDFNDMWQNFAKHVIKFENKTGRFIPKFSMIPEE